jgi:hypothetical protein
MEWYNYIAGLFAGAFLANFVPHFVHGISGNKFPTPFSKPRGVGLSSSTTNVIWALFNLVVGYLLFIASQADREHPVSLLVVFIGISLVSVGGSIRFQGKHKE